MRNTNIQSARAKRNNKPVNPSLGPVSNLEQYLESDWWRRIFNSMYLKTDADVVEDRNITNSELDLFTGILELKPEHSILDLACGAGNGSIKIILSVAKDHWLRVSTVLSHVR